MAESTRPSPVITAAPSGFSAKAARKSPKPRASPHLPDEGGQGPPLLTVPRKSFSTSSLPHAPRPPAAAAGRHAASRKESQRPPSADYSRVLIFGLIASNALWGLLLKGADRRDPEGAPPAASGGAWGSRRGDAPPPPPAGGAAALVLPAEQDLETLHSEAYVRGGVTVTRRRPARGLGLQGFVLFSAYRTGPASFAAMGLAALEFHTLKRSEQCRWEPPDGAVVTGEAQIHYPGESHQLEYEAVLFLCEMTGVAAGAAGGTLTIRIDGADSAVYSELPGAEHGDAPAFRSNITHCSAPLYGAVHAARVREWMLFHERMHGVDRFVVYDAGGVDAAVRAELAPYAAAGRLEVVDVRGTLKYETWAYSQVLVVNDCAYRTRGAARWTLFTDFDEYLMIPAGGAGRRSLSLANYLAGRGNLPWISFGSVFFSCKHCVRPKPGGSAARGGDSRWAVEKLVFGEPWVHCKNTTRFRNRDMCLKYEGHRKFVVQASQVNVLQIHRVMNPAKGGVNMPAKEGRINHYRGLTGLDKRICRYNWTEGQLPPNLIAMPLVSSMAEVARTMDSSTKTALSRS